MAQYDVFISYRRDGGEMLAHILYERLKDRGYRVFQDVESLRSGDFNEKLYQVIEECRDFILILSPDCLARCDHEKDWVRKEIVHALKQGKNIVPILMRGFEWPEELPREIDAIRYKNGIAASMEYFDQFIVRLQEFLTAGAANQKTRRRGITIRSVLLGVLYVLGLLSPLVILYVLDQPFVLWQRLLYACWLIGGAAWMLNRIETRPEVAASCFSTLTEAELNETPAVVYSRVSGAFGKGHLISNKVPEGFVSYYAMDLLEFGSWDGKKTNYLKLRFRRALEWYDPSVLYLHSLSRGTQAVKMLTRQGFVLQLTPADVPEGIDYLTKGTLHVFLSYHKKRLAQVEIYNCTDAELRERMRKDDSNDRSLAEG